ncbi:ATP-binding protein [Chryseobacterium camelliae]
MYKVIAEQTIADAILDRMVHNSLKIDLKGESMRRKKADQKISSE